MQHAARYYYLLERCIQPHTYFLSVIGIPWIVCRALDVRSLTSIWGLKSFMNCLNESVGTKKWSVGFYYFILLLSIMHNIYDDLHIQPVCSDGVVRINGLWSMPLLVDYVGSLVLFPKSWQTFSYTIHSF